MQIPFCSVYIVFANYEKIRIYFLYTLLEIYGKKIITFFSLFIKFFANSLLKLKQFIFN